MVVERDCGGEGGEACDEAEAEGLEGAMSLQVWKIDSMRWRIGARCRGGGRVRLCVVAA